MGVYAYTVEARARLTEGIHPIPLLGGTRGAGYDT